MLAGMKPRAALCCAADRAAMVYALGRLDRLKERVDLVPGIIDTKCIEARIDELRDIEVIFSTWGMPSLTEAHIDGMPRLRAIFYAAGSVQAFAEPVLKRGIVVCSAWRANAVPVAEFTLAQVLLAGKGYFANRRAYRKPSDHWSSPRGPGIFDLNVSLLGAGAIGRLVIDHLKRFEINVRVFDPFLSDDQARTLGVTQVSFEDAFRTGMVVSNHLANVPATLGMLRGAHFDSMPTGATFINTGRGATVDEPEMIDVLMRRPDLTALLDVTHPEPPADGSPLYTLPNVQLTGHIAGSVKNECVRMADYMIEEYDRFERGEALKHAVTLEMLPTMA
jgi:phosphoglycerate dehydrogenase-like enzyme